MHANLKNQGKGSKVADIRIYFPGTVADRVMRRWLDQDSPQPGQMQAWVAQILEAEEQAALATGDGRVRWKHVGDKAEVLAAVTECVTKLEPLLARFVLPYNYEPAVRFRVPLVIPFLDGTPQRIWLVGEMDLLVGWEVPGARQHAIWDLKMTRDNSYWRKTAGQLSFYELVVFAWTGAYPVVSGLIQPLCDEPYKLFEFPDEDRRVLFGDVARYASAVWRKDFPLRPDPDKCPFCDTRHACPRYQPIPGTHRVPWTVTGT